MCCKAVEKFWLASHPVPKTLYMDHGCCCAQWSNCTLVGQCDGCASRHLSTSSTQPSKQMHSKYAAFKSVLPVKVVRAKDRATLSSVSDQDVVPRYISREQLTHHVWRITFVGQGDWTMVQPTGHCGAERSCWAGQKWSEPLHNTC